MDPYDNATCFFFGSIFTAHLIYRYRRVFTISAPELASLARIIPPPQQQQHHHHHHSKHSSSNNNSSSGEGESLIFRFLLVVALVSTADRLQGMPFYFSPISPTGTEFGPTRIYNSSMVYLLHFLWWVSCLSLGVALAGPISDRFGRRFVCRIYCGLVIASALIHHISRKHWTMAVSRVLGGVASAMVMPQLESWFVSELLASSSTHHSLPAAAAAAAVADSGFEGMFVIRFASTTAAGLIGTFAQYVYQNHPWARIDTAAFALTLPALLLVHRTWNENSPSSLSSSPSLLATVRTSLMFLRTDRAVQSVFLLQNAFESLLLVFIFAVPNIWQTILFAADDDAVRTPYIEPVLFLAVASGAASCGWMCHQLLPQLFPVDASSSSRLVKQQQQFVIRILIPSSMVLLVLSAATLMFAPHLRMLTVSQVMLQLFVIGISLPCAASFRAAVVQDGTCRSSMSILMRLPSLVVAACLGLMMIGERKNNANSPGQGIKFWAVVTAVGFCGLLVVARRMLHSQAF